MGILKAIDLKVFRDVARQAGQLGAIALVIACGFGVFVGMRATMRTVEQARASYYASERFGHVFASLKRAPEAVARQLGDLPGVQSLQTRVVADVTLDVEGMREAAVGRLVSIPDHERPRVNDLRLRSGRMPEAGHGAEVLANEAFMEAHAFPLGTRIGAVINGRLVDLKIVGTALSPEYTYAIGPGQIFPDDKRFGVFWMRREPLAAAFDMRGAFNDISLCLARDARMPEVLDRVNLVLDRYGGLRAIERADQTSAFFLENDLTQLATFAFMIPSLFLAVAAFLLNIVFGRLIASQRGDIAALKAFGYTDLEVGLHYAKLVALVMVAGWVLGVGIAAWIGTNMTRMYGEYYRFPELALQLGLRECVEGLAFSAIGAVVGTAAAIRRTIVLPPAEAMRPEAPPTFRPTFVERMGLARWLPTPTRIVLRELERKPLRALMSISGIALAVALVIVNSFTLDSVQHMLGVQYGLASREDLQLTLAEPRSLGALSELSALPGAVDVEPFRSVPVEFRSERRSKRASITGLERDGRLMGLLDTDLVDVPLPPAGVVLSRKLAELLGVRTGDALKAEILEGERRVAEVRVARVVETFIGIEAHMELAALCRLLGETPTLNGARMLVDDAELEHLHRIVKRTPRIAGLAARDDVLREVRRMLDQNIGAFVLIGLGFSLVMALGVLYNTARITLAERSRELATLRVLGFRRSEVNAILYGEIIVLVALALPLGLLAGHGMARGLVSSPGFDTEQFRLPFVIAPSTYASACLTVILAATISAWIARRGLDRFDMVEVLKSRD